MHETLTRGGGFRQIQAELNARIAQLSQDATLTADEKFEAEIGLIVESHRAWERERAKLDWLDRWGYTMLRLAPRRAAFSPPRPRSSLRGSRRRGYRRVPRRAQARSPGSSDDPPEPDLALAGASA